MKNDDVIQWKHFPRYWYFVRGIHRSSVNSSHKCQWHGALMFSLICAWMNGWHSREAGGLRRHRAHDDVTNDIEGLSQIDVYITTAVGGVMVPISSIMLFSSFSEFSEYWLPVENRVHVWQVSLYTVSMVTSAMHEVDSKRYLAGIFRLKIRDLPCGETNERSFSNPHSRSFSLFAPTLRYKIPS